MTLSAQNGRRLVAALTDLRTALADLRLPLETAGAADDRVLARRLRDQLDDHLLPRVRQLGAPLLAVVGGSTGAGKSTLVNSLLREEVSPSGVIRPTTREPVLVHHPDEGAWFTSDRVLPRLARITGPARPQEGAAGDGGLGGDGAPGGAGATGDGAGALRLVPHPGVPHGLALLDAPDIDSVVAANRRLGEELLGAADLWVFATTAARYADAVPWDLLAEAARRRAVVLLVLNRVEPGARDAVTGHLRRMLTERELDAHVVVVPETQVEGGLLPPAATGELGGWLRAVVGDAGARDGVVERTVRGAAEDLLAAVPHLAAAADEQRRHAERLREAVADAYAAAGRDVAAATGDGTMLRGEVLARWQEFVGTGELLRALEERVGSWRDRLTAAVRGRPAPEHVTRAVGDGLVHLVVDAADRAAEQAHGAWHADPAGAALLGGLRLSRASADLPEHAAAEVRAWQGAVLELVSTEGAGRRATARALSFGVNGLGAALMVAVFASTGGLTTAEVGVAGGTALLAQRLLEAVFGDDAVRRLTQVAHDDLRARVDALLDAEADRFTALVDAADVRPDGADRLRHAVAGLTVTLVELGDAPPAPVPPPPPAAAPGARGDAAGGRTGGALRRWWRRLWQG